MSKLQEAAAIVKQLAAQFKPLIELGAALEEIDSLEQAKKDLSSHKEALMADVENINAHAAELEKKNSDLILENIKIVQAAEDEARRIVDQAVKQGDAYLFAATAESKKIEAEIEAKKDEFNNQYTRAQLDLSHKKAEADEQEARLKNINEQLAKIKEL